MGYVGEMCAVLVEVKYPLGLGIFDIVPSYVLEEKKAHRLHRLAGLAQVFLIINPC
jgi:hypothetical protein